MIEAYPLQWPLHKHRTPAEKRERANFSALVIGSRARRLVTMSEAVSRVKSELDRYTKVGKPFRVPEGTVVISTNIPLKKDGLPYSGLSQPSDTGVAVYFTLDGKDYCLPCDKWDRVEDNLAAVAAHISAMRGIERWGVGELHDVYTGYKAIPETVQSSPDVWVVLGLDGEPSNAEEVKAAYRKRAAIVHPDKPSGSHEAFTELQQAYEIAIKMF